MTDFLPLGGYRVATHGWQFKRGAVDAEVQVTGGLVKLRLRTRPQPAIQWCQQGEYLISLGVPHGWDFNTAAFFWGKYYKTKSLLSTWHDVERMSPTGSAMVSNAMVLSRFRYWTSCMVMPKAVADAIDSDIQALVWGKEVEFDAQQAGSDEGRKFLSGSTQYNPRGCGGLGLLHWESHCKALAAVASSYRRPSAQESPSSPGNETEHTSRGSPGAAVSRTSSLQAKKNPSEHEQVEFLSAHTRRPLQNIHGRTGAGGCRIKFGVNRALWPSRVPSVSE